MMRKIAQYRFVSLASLASFALVAGGFFWAYGALRNAGTEPLILHFNDLNGITAIGSFSRLLLMGILGAAIVIVNFFVALELEERDRVLGKVMASMTLVIAVLLFIGFAAILNVN